MRNLLEAQNVIGVPDNSRALILSGSDVALLRSKNRDHKLLHGFGKGAVFKRMNKLGKKADAFAHSILEHVRLSPKISETLKGNLSFGARILQVGGMEKVYKTLFNVCEKERLLKASHCYLSTTAGPIAGLLFISTRNVAFCSERSLKLSGPNGEPIRVDYKVLILLSKIETANQSENSARPSQKYMQIATVDNFDFWFMGFLNYQKTWKHIQQAIFLKQKCDK